MAVQRSTSLPGEQHRLAHHYGECYRSKLPISTSRAEGCVDEIANARMAKKQRMRWSPRGALRVAVFRAAVLDSRLSVRMGLPLAA
jgi:hypothetical protein